MKKEIKNTFKIKKIHLIQQKGNEINQNPKKSQNKHSYHFAHNTD